MVIRVVLLVMSFYKFKLQFRMHGWCVLLFAASLGIVCTLLTQFKYIKFNRHVAVVLAIL